MGKPEEKKINGAAAGEEVREVPTIPLDHFKLREMAHNSYLVQVPEGIEPKDLTKPHIYIAASSQLMPFDLLWVVAHDESWMAEIRVRHSEGARVQAQVLRVEPLEPRSGSYAGDELPAGHRIVEGTIGQGNWVVEREDPAKPGTWHVMASGANYGLEGRWTYKDAKTWLQQHATIRKPAPGRLGR